MDYRRRRPKFPFNPMKNKKMVLASFLLWAGVIYYFVVNKQSGPEEDEQIINQVNIKEREAARSMRSDMNVKRSRDGRIIKITPLKGEMDSSKIGKVLKDGDNRKTISSKRLGASLKNKHNKDKIPESERVRTTVAVATGAQKNVLQKTLDMAKKINVLDLAKDWFAKPRNTSELKKNENKNTNKIRSTDFKNTGNKKAIGNDELVPSEKTQNVKDKIRQSESGNAKRAGATDGNGNMLQKTFDMAKKFQVIDMAKNWFAKPSNRSVIRKDEKDSTKIAMATQEAQNRKMTSSVKHNRPVNDKNGVTNIHRSRNVSSINSGFKEADKNTLQKTFDMAKDWFVKPANTSATKDKSNLLNVPTILDHVTDHMFVLNAVKRIFRYSQKVETLNLNITKDIVKKTTLPPKMSPLEKVLKERVGFNRVSSFDANDSVSLCDCSDVSGHCNCCSQMTVSLLGINKTSCVNVYFNETLLAFDVQLVVDKKLILQKMFRAKQKAQLCVTDSNHMDMCLIFKNLTYTVTVVDGYNRVSSIRGCVFTYLRVLNKTVGVFPSRCFRMKFKS